MPEAACIQASCVGMLRRERDRERGRKREGERGKGGEGEGERCNGSGGDGEREKERERAREKQRERAREEDRERHQPPRHESRHERGGEDLFLILIQPGFGGLESQLEQVLSEVGLFQQ